MVFTLIAMIIGLGCIALFIGDYIRGKVKLRTLRQTTVNNTVELGRLREKEHHLQHLSDELQDKLDRAIVDSVTNLLGWQLFEDRVIQGVKESMRYLFSMAILYVDIDDFKVVNDALGYEVGNALLHQVSQRLKGCIRQVDSISRISKDTFAVMLPQLGKPETAAIVAQRMMQSVLQPFVIQGHELYVTLSIGLAIFPNDGNDATTLFRGADYALHLAKEKGKNNYQFYQERMNINSQRELAINTGLKRENLPAEFAIYYQPIMNVRDQNVACMDALLHWEHPELGLISTQELFDYAGKQGKSNAITEWLLSHSCKQFLYWRKLGFKPPLLGIPISIKQLENSNFIYRISQIMQELSFKPEWLLLEIKVATTQLSFDRMEKAFNMLNYLGVKLCIADFGIRGFSLVDLKNFIIHYVKLDAELTNNLEQDQRGRALLQSIQALASNLTLQIIAQEVNSAQQAKYLNELGVILLQGNQIGSATTEKEVQAKMIPS